MFLALIDQCLGKEEREPEIFIDLAIDLRNPNSLAIFSSIDAFKASGKIGRIDRGLPHDARYTALACVTPSNPVTDKDFAGLRGLGVKAELVVLPRS